MLDLTYRGAIGMGLNAVPLTVICLLDLIREDGMADL